MAPEQNLGSWNPNTNVPALASGSGNYGDTVTASADGAVSPSIDGITSVEEGDTLFFDGTAWVLNTVVRPKQTDRIPWLKPVHVHLGTNGRDFDTIQLEVILAKAGIRVQDLNVPMGYSRIVEVRQADSAGEFTRCIAVGQLATQSQRLSRSTEALGATARFDWFLYGDRLKHYRVWDDKTSSFLTVAQDIVFNPYIDQQIEGNRSSQLDFDSNGADVRVFAPPESLRSTAAIALQNQSRDRWDLPTAILTLCWLLNDNETFVVNPTLIELQAVITDTATRLMKNVRIPLGSSLPEALDIVCEAMGYRWFIEHVVDHADPDLKLQGTNLRFFKNGVGITSDLKCQRVDESITSDETNIADYDARLEIATPNVIYGRGSLVKREGTFELVPGWRKSLDITPLEQIKAQLFQDSDANELRNVARFWVLNEAGDWGDPAFRPGVAAYTDLSDLFEQDAVRLVRRKFLPMLTKTKTAADQALRGSGGIVVEWNDKDGNWQPYPGGWSVAQHQCGIQLEGDIVTDFWEEFLRKARQVGGATALAAHLRVTACIEGDFRQSYTAHRREEAPNGRDISLHLDVDDRFHDRLVRLDGDFESRWDGNHFDITNLQQAAPQSFLIGSDVTARLKAGQTFIVRGSTGNDGRYTVESVALVSGTSTRIFVAEPIPDATIDGKVGLDTEEAADRPALIKLCEEARNVHDGAKVVVSANLKGHDWHEYKRGNIVTAVQPRGLSLNNYHNLAPESRHPQIIGLNYSFQDDSQRTELVLDVPEAERPELERNRYGAL